jgi:hypothetical protein
VYHSHQSNFKARRFDHIVNTLLNEYFGTRKNPTVWLDPYEVRESVCATACALRRRAHRRLHATRILPQ